MLFVDTVYAASLQLSTRPILSVSGNQGYAGGHAAVYDATPPPNDAAPFSTPRSPHQRHSPVSPKLNCFHLERSLPIPIFSHPHNKYRGAALSRSPWWILHKNYPRGGALHKESQPTSEIIPPHTVPSPAHLPGASRAPTHAPARSLPALACVQRTCVKF